MMLDVRVLFLSGSLETVMEIPSLVDDSRQWKWIGSNNEERQKNPGGNDIDYCYLHQKAFSIRRRSCLVHVGIGKALCRTRPSAKSDVQIRHVFLKIGSIKETPLEVHIWKCVIFHQHNVGRKASSLCSNGILKRM